MGNEVSKVDLKYDVIRANNQVIGLNEDGSKPGYGLADTTFEKGALAAGALMPVWQYKGKIGEAWQNRSWQNFGTAYKNGWHNAGQTLRHPMNYWDLEFVNSKVAKLEGVMNKVTPKLPEGFSGSPEAKDLFEKLKNAKNQKEYSKLVRDNSKTYKKLVKILDKTAPDELKKLRNIAKYNEIYGDVLKEFKTAQSSMTAGRPLAKGQVAQLHKKFADARLAENKFIQSAKNAANISKKAKAGAKMSKGVKTAMAASKTLRSVSRGVGKAGGWLLAGMSVATAGLDIYTAVAASPDGEGVKNGFKQAAKSAGRLACELGGMAIGQWAGAAIGQVLIPIPGVGAAIGGFLGSMVGGWLGSKVADKIPAINKTVAEEIQEEQMQQQNQVVCDAIENNDVETVYNYTSQFKEQVLDEQGNPMQDENGNPVLRYVQISDDEEEQKAFEKRIESLDNYVETEASKQQRAAELKAQAEQAKQQQQLQQQQMNFGGSLSYGYGYGPAGTTAPVSSSSAGGTVSGYGPNGTGSTSTASNTGFSWMNPAWQNSLASQYNNGNFYTFNPNNYSPMWMPYNQNYGLNTAA